MKMMMLSFMVVSYLFLTGCANTVSGIRQDIAKPFTYMGKVGDRIAGKPVEKVNEE